MKIKIVKREVNIVTLIVDAKSVDDVEDVCANYNWESASRVEDDYEIVSISEDTSPELTPREALKMYHEGEINIFRLGQILGFDQDSMLFDHLYDAQFECEQTALSRMLAHCGIDEYEEETEEG